MNGQITEEADDNKRVQAANSTREGFESTSHQESLVSRGKEAGPTNLSQTKPGSHPQPRGASGPRTSQGKQRSKYNAIKHGIFAAVVLPKGESRVQYESLLGGLFEDLSPQGRLEETLVEKLAMILWRHRRLIQAENAEMRNSTEFLEWEEENRQVQSLKGLNNPDFDLPQIIDQIEKPKILERCLELLVGLKEELVARGFEEESDFTSIEDNLWYRPTIQNSSRYLFYVVRHITGL